MSDQNQAAQEWHYAPLSGDLLRKAGEQFLCDKNWEERHASMGEFLRLIEDQKIGLVQTVNYGHPIFHGHSGRVDVYRKIESEHEENGNV